MFAFRKVSPELSLSRRMHLCLTLTFSIHRWKRMESIDTDWSSGSFHAVPLCTSAVVSFQNGSSGGYCLVRRSGNVWAWSQTTVRATVFKTRSISRLLVVNRDEEKRRMVHSTSVKNLQRCAIKSSSSAEEQIRDLLSSMISRIEKDAEPSHLSPESPLLLFDVASPVHRAVSTDLELYPTSSIDGQDLFQPLDDYKHSVGVLCEDKDLPQVPARKYLVRSS